MAPLASPARPLLPGLSYVVSAGLSYQSHARLGQPKCVSAGCPTSTPTRGMKRAHVNDGVHDTGQDLPMASVVPTSRLMMHNPDGQRT